jgi:prevent-host-death family protein
MTHTLPITKAREDLATLVENANKKLEEYIITVNGLPAAVLISAAEYQSWKETNEIMADSGFLHAIREGEDDIKNDRFVTFEQLKKGLNLHV